MNSKPKGAENDVTNSTAVKKEGDTTTKTKEKPGPQSYNIQYKLAEQKARGGQAAFGMTRQKFLEKEEQKKQTQNKRG